MQPLVKRLAQQSAKYSTQKSIGSKADVTGADSVTLGPYFINI